MLPQDYSTKPHIETNFFDINEGGIVEIKRGQSMYEHESILNQNRKSNQESTDSTLNNQGPAWGKLRWPILLQKLLEKRDFKTAEGQNKIDCLLHHAKK